MKQRQVWALAGVLLVVGVLVSGDPSIAGSTKTDVDFWEVSCQLDPGITWVSDDGVLHNRGRVSEALFYEEDSGVAVLVGSDTVIGNANIDLATGSGRVFGTFSLIYIPDPGSADGTFDGTFNGSLTGGFMCSGRVVGPGTGDLRGKKMKLSIESEPPPDWLMAEIGPDPCGGLPPGIFYDTGFIHDPRGD